MSCLNKPNILNIYLKSKHVDAVSWYKYVVTSMFYNTTLTAALGHVLQHSKGPIFPVTICLNVAVYEETIVKGF